MEAQNQRTDTLANFTVLSRTVRSSHRRCSIKKLFLKILQNPQKTHVLESLFKRVAALKACNFIKTRLLHRCFPMNIAKFLRLPILKNFCERLLFDCFNGSLLHGPKGSKSRLYGSVRLHGPSHRSSFLFLRQHLFLLNRAPTSVRKPKTNTFDESIKGTPMQI